MDRIEKARQSASKAAGGARRTAATAGSAVQGRIADITATVQSHVAKTAMVASSHVKGAASSAQAQVDAVVKELPGSSRRARRRSLDASEMSAEEKLGLCRELVALALSDGVLHPGEVSALYLLLTTLELEPSARTELRGMLAVAQRERSDAVTTPSAAAPSSDAGALLVGVDAERREALATALLHHMVAMARADGEISDVERERIRAVAASVFHDGGEVVVSSIERLAEHEADFLAGRITTGQFESAAKDIAAKAAAFGAPIAAIYTAGSVAGLGAAGITSGLATLGFGGLLGLSSMVTGIGTVVIVGVLVHQGARYALGNNERSREKKRDHLMQQVITNHQRAIADLTDDIGHLARRMDEQLSRTTQNESHLAELRSDLEAFQLALADLHASKNAVEEQAAAP